HSPFRVAVLTHRAFHFRVPGVTDENRFFATATSAGDFHMHFGHQRAGGVEYRQITAFRFVTYRLRNTVCGENQDCAVRHFANLLNKDSPTLAQAIDHIAVMHHFVTDIYRCAVNGQRVFNNADSAVYPGTKTTRVGQQDLHVTPPVPDRFPALQYQNERSARPADG